MLLPSANKQFHRIDGATHYYREQPQHQMAAVGIIERWIAELPGATTEQHGKK